MSASNATENDLLELICKGIDPSWRAAASGYFALFTADPTDTGSLANECSDATYARVAATKATAWTDGGSTFSNAAQVNWSTLTESGIAAAVLSAAAAAPIAANIERVRGQGLQGTGTEGNPWGPA